MILRSPLPRIHYYQNKWLQVKGILVPSTNLQLNLYPNTQLDLFCSDNLSFSMHGSQYVTNQFAWIFVHDLITNLRRMLAAKFFSSSHDENYEVAWSQNPMVYKTQQLFHEKEELGKTRFPVTLFFTLVELCSYATCVTFYSPQNNPYICLGL